MVEAGSTDNPASVTDLGPGATYVWSIDDGVITTGDGAPTITFRKWVSQ